MDTAALLEFRFDLGAPWLNLLATRGRNASAHPVERIPTPARLQEWLERSELAPLEPPMQVDVDTAHEVREALRALALATVRTEPPPTRAVADIVDLLATEPDPVLLAAADRLVRTAPDTTRSALARLARQAVDHLTGVQRQDLMICDERDCHGVFIDPTGRRRWCPAPACASRGRVRAFRERRRS